MQENPQVSGAIPEEQSTTVVLNNKATKLANVKAWSRNSPGAVSWAGRRHSAGRTQRESSCVACDGTAVQLPFLKVWNESHSQNFHEQDQRSFIPADRRPRSLVAGVAESNTGFTIS